MVNPAVRRKARERALQFLFGLEFTNYAWEDAIESFWEANPARPGVKTYTEKLIRGVCEGQDALDDEVASALQHWTPERVGRVERNILRLALYEMRHSHDVPTAVAINEAIEIAKKFSTEESGKFVNGVLDNIRRARRTP